jgi:hypothetical protein
MSKEILIGFIVIALIAGFAGYLIGKNLGSSLPGLMNGNSTGKFGSGIIKSVSGSALVLDTGWTIDISKASTTKAGKPIALSAIKTGMFVSVEFKKKFSKPGIVSAADVLTVVISDINTGGELKPGQVVVPVNGPYNPPK